MFELKKNIVFVHIPKAGGTSVRSFIAKHVRSQDIFPEDKLHHFPRYDTLSVDGPRLFMSHLGYDFVRDAKADAFILLRHPVERLLSLYSYAVHPGENVPIISPASVSGMSLTDFLLSDKPEIRMNVDNAQLWQVASGYSARHRQLRLEKGITLDHVSRQAIENIEKSSVVGVLDDMPGFYEDILEYFGVTGGYDRPDIKNVSEKRIRWDDLSEQEKVLVENCVKHEWDVYEAAKHRQHV